MAAEIELLCESCEEMHMFCLTGADLIDGDAEYEYNCPITGTTVTRTVDKFAKVITGCQKLVVPLRLVER